MEKLKKKPFFFQAFKTLLKTDTILVSSSQLILRLHFQALVFHAGWNFQNVLRINDMQQVR